MSNDVVMCQNPSIFTISYIQSEDRFQTRFTCSFPRVVKYNNARQDCEKEHIFKEERIKVVKGCFNMLTFESNLAVLKKTNVKKIYASGDLFLHKCRDEIGEIEAGGIVCIDGCEKVKNVSANTIFILNPSDCETLKSRAGPTYVFADPTSDTLTIENVKIGGKFIIDPIHKTVVVSVNCELPEIVFPETPDQTEEYTVIVKKEATFTGKVTGGKLIFEDSQV